MAEQKSHILLDGFSSNEDFRSRRTGRNPIVPPQNRLAHGQRLSARYAQIVAHYEERRAQAEPPITEDIGIYVEIIGAPGVKLPLYSLDTRDFKLRSCRIQGNSEVALVFVPESRINPI
jgi:hypothetical protein